MATIVKFLLFCFALLSFIYTFYVTCSLMLFLSSPRRISTVYTWVFNLLDNKSRLETAYGPIVFDTLYTLGFIFLHSFMKSYIVKGAIKTFGLATAERAIYCLTSSLCLNYLMKNWMSAQTIVLWQVDVESSKVLWWTFSLVHTISWVVIYGGSIIMDLPELLGIKQTFNDLNNYGSPDRYKSYQLRKVYTHVRHPSFIGLSVILWATNLMTIDRLVLAILLTAYMYLAWSTDKNDVRYQKQQLERKIRELSS